MRTILVALLSLATAVAQTPIHNGSTGTVGQAGYVCGTPASSGFGGGVAQSVKVTLSRIDFQTGGTLAAGTTTSAVVAVVSLGYDATCSTLMSSIDPSWTGIVIADPTSPNVISVDLAGYGSPNALHTTSINQPDWPAAPGWVWYVQLVEIDASGAWNAFPWAAQHSLSL